MKSVTAFVGSARKRGFTSAATRQLLDTLQSSGDVRGEIVFLSECSLGLCRGCKACFLGWSVEAPQGSLRRRSPPAARRWGIP